MTATMTAPSVEMNTADLIVQDGVTADQTRVAVSGWPLLSRRT